MAHACYCVTKHSAPLERMECPTPEPRGAEVLIRMTAAGVCHSDIHIWEGVYDLGAGNQMTLKDRGVSLPLTMPAGRSSSCALPMIRYSASSTRLMPSGSWRICRRGRKRSDCRSIRTRHGSYGLADMRRLTVVSADLGDRRLSPFWGSG